MIEKKEPDKKFRYEIKYSINNIDFCILKHRFNSIMKLDENCLEESYRITSIYFDTFAKTSFNQVLDGISERWKYRIRFYNNDDNLIFLEKKYKVNSKVHKKSIKISKEEFQKIMAGYSTISKNYPPLLNEFYLKVKTELLKPLILIEYDRIPYVYFAGNVRLTLDYNIGCSTHFKECFNEEKNLIYLEEKILEVKYDEFIPEFIRCKLELDYLEQISFSKFKSCILCLKEGGIV